MLASPYVNPYLRKWPHFFLVYIKIEIVDVYVCMSTYSSRMDTLFCTKLGMLFLWDQKDFFRKAKTKKKKKKKKMSWVLVPVAWKLSTIERCQDQRRFFKGDYRRRAHNPKICPWFKSWWLFFCGSETKQNTRLAPKPNLFVSARRLQEQRP
jgi:hypothetical protein